ncbi:MAG TPA: hypothetical protein VKA55_11295 [Gammaproteobacteria bacterium]|nr:hypothetical protein [Gammaproteobacteria bacterium]
MGPRVSAHHLPDHLVQRSDVRLLVSGRWLQTDAGKVMTRPRQRRSELLAEGLSPRARWALRRRRLVLWARSGRRFAAGGTVGMVAGWTLTALWVLAH